MTILRALIFLVLVGSGCFAPIARADTPITAYWHLQFANEHWVQVGSSSDGTEVWVSGTHPPGWNGEEIGQMVVLFPQGEQQETTPGQTETFFGVLADIKVKCATSQFRYFVADYIRADRSLFEVQRTDEWSPILPNTGPAYMQANYCH